VTAPQAVIHVGAKPKANKKLFVLLGVVIVLVIALKAAPSLLGGGAGAVKTFHPSSVFHLRPATTVPPSSGGPALAVRPSRDPFAAPPGVVGH
jgi:hypothetical protein